MLDKQTMPPENSAKPWDFPQSDVVQLALHHSGEGVILCDMVGVITYMNEYASRFGNDQITSIHQLFKKFYSLKYQSEVIQSEPLFLSIIAGERVDFEVAYKSPASGEINILQIRGQPVKNAAGAVNGALIYLVDKSMVKYAERWLERQSRVLEHIATGDSSVTILHYLISALETQHKGAVCSLFTLEQSTRKLTHTAGSLPDVLVERVVQGQQDFMNIAHRPSKKDNQVLLCNSEASLQNYHEIALKLGYRSTWVKTIRASSGSFLGLFAICHPEVKKPTPFDHRTFETYAYTTGILISREHDVETIKFLTYNDKLTGLPNRSYLLERLTNFIDHSKRNKIMLGLLVIDIDRFKSINNSVGHAVGDSVLRVIADRLRICMGTTDIIARIGGDEFAILVPGLRSQEFLTSLTNVILGLLKEEILVNGHSFRLTASIGASIFPMDGWDGETILKNAETAMYRAKHQGFNKFQLYSMEMNERLYDTLLLESDLHRALQQAEFYLEYQPRVDSGSGKMTSAEALIRWAHPIRGNVSPVEFIPLAEDNGLIIPIGFWVLETVCKQLNEWQDAGLDPVRIAINVSTRQFEHPDFLVGFQNCIELHNIPPKLIEIEITESLLMKQAEDTAWKLQALQNLGVSVSIDDFGVGYSSLGLLKRLSLNSLKIDRSFIHDMLSDVNSAAIVSAIIHLGHVLGLEVIAEGVETPEQLEFLQTHKCERVQGFLFSRPVSTQDFERYLETQLTFVRMYGVKSY